MSELIIIQDDACWICGKPFGSDDEMKRTNHHTLPQHLNPAKNITVPIHEKCHDKVTIADVNGIYSYLLKLNRAHEQLTSQTLKLTKYFELLNEMVENAALIKLVGVKNGNNKKSGKEN